LALQRGLWHGAGGQVDVRVHVAVLAAERRVGRRRERLAGVEQHRVARTDPHQELVLLERRRPSPLRPPREARVNALEAGDRIQRRGRRVVAPAQLSPQMVRASGVLPTSTDCASG